MPHAGRGEPEQRAAHEAAVVDRAKLVHQEVGVAREASGSRYVNAQRLGIGDQIGGAE